MILFHRYQHSFSLETAKSGERLLRDLRSEFRSPQARENGITVRHKPSSLKFWEGHGKIRISLNEGGDGKTIVRGEVIPGMLLFDSGQIIFLAVMGLLVLLMVKTGLTLVMLLVGIVLLLGLMLVSPWVLFLLLSAGLLLSIASFDRFAFSALILGWLFFLLMIHMHLRHNRRELEIKLYRSLRK